MPVYHNQTLYLVGLPIPQRSLPSAYTDIGTVSYMNRDRPLFKSYQSGQLLMCVQHPNSEWPTFYPLKTQSELLKDWH